MFMKALEAMNKLDDPMFGDLKPDDTVDVYFNLTAGPEAERRGPWNSEPDFHIRDLVPQAHSGRRRGARHRVRALAAEEVAKQTRLPPSCGAACRIHVARRRND